MRVSCRVARAHTLRAGDGLVRTPAVPHVPPRALRRHGANDRRVLALLEGHAEGPAAAVVRVGGALDEPHLRVGRRRARPAAGRRRLCRRLHARSAAAVLCRVRLRQQRVRRVQRATPTRDRN